MKYFTTGKKNYKICINDNTPPLDNCCTGPFFLVLLYSTIDTTDEDVSSIKSNGTSKKPETNNHHHSIAKVKKSRDKIHNVKLQVIMIIMLYIGPLGTDAQLRPSILLCLGYNYTAQKKIKTTAQYLASFFVGGV